MTNMMTEIEALENIVDSGINLGAGDFVDVEALKVAVKALEKQIPKKTYQAWGLGGLSHYCPICNNKVHTVINYNYCFECGQKLDWK